MRSFLVLSLLVWAPGVLFAQREFGFDNRKPSGQPYLAAEETVKRFKVAPEFEAKLFAGEPQVVNPIAFTIDEKGRVWVVESFEYPKRTPKGKMPRDRIVILEDTDGDGVCDKRSVFADGKDFPKSFDMASGIEVGHGGVFLGAPPYLWFIENKNDKPGKFEVLLEGFGSHDTHETLNTFQWGPDGWLYGLHGVFTHSEVKSADDQADNPRGPSVKMNAAIWRYHPTTRKFEIFAEGTSNPWGMDWRNTDGQFILCCCVIPHLFHVIPGGNYKRQAGSSFNPYAYGEIKEICDHTFHRESGWAHAGLISLDVPHMPEKYRNSVIFGSIHGCSIKQNILKPNGSTYIASRGDDFLVSGDKNFRPINMKWGPNGDIFLIDWHDQNPCHQTPPDNWDYEHGRVYRIQLKGAATKKAEDLAKLGDDALLAKLSDPNPFVSRQALRLVYERHAAKPLPATNTPKIRSWHDLRTLSAIGAALSFDPSIVTADNPVAAAWLVRFAADKRTPTDGEVRWMAAAVRPTPDIPIQTAPAIRREIASAAIRLAGNRDVTPILHELMLVRDAGNDPVLSHLIWLGYEKLLGSASNTVLDAELAWLAGEAQAKVLTPDKIIVNFILVEDILPKVARRLGSTGNPDHLERCIDWIGKLDNSYGSPRTRALEGLAAAMQGKLVDAPPNWSKLRDALLADNNAAVTNLVNKLSVNFRDPEAVRRALRDVVDSKLSTDARVDAARAIALLRPEQGEPLLLKLVTAEESLPVRVEAARALSAYSNPDLARELVVNWPKYPPALRGEIVSVLAGRKEWARTLLVGVAERRIQRTELTDNHILRMRAFKDRDLDDEIQKVWGKFRDTPADLAKLIDQMRNRLYEGDASFSRGKVVFENLCAKCHKFDGRGAEVGPPLDGAGRDIEYLLANIIDPNRVIGSPYFIRVVELKNGRNEIGLLAAEDEQSITLKIENGVTKVIPRKEIESIDVQEKSLMPEGIDKNLTPQAFRDVIRYVMANPFLNHVKLNGMPLKVGPHGRIPLFEAKDTGEAVIEAAVTAPAAMKTKLLLGGAGATTVKLNGKTIYKGALSGSEPDQAAVDVELVQGSNTLTIETSYTGVKAAVYARYLDPERRLRYPD